MKYFAYGSNCNAEIMHKKEVPFSSQRRAVLSGYRFAFNKKALREHLSDAIGYANIIEDDSGVVEGVLYEICETGLQRLDCSERYPDHYNRVAVQVEADGRVQSCWAYKAQLDKTASGLVPQREYLDHILAAKEFLSEEYYLALNKSPTYHRE